MKIRSEKCQIKAIMMSWIDTWKCAKTWVSKSSWEKRVDENWLSHIGQTFGPSNIGTGPEAVWTRFVRLSTGSRVNWTGSERDWTASEGNWTGSEVDWTGSENNLAASELDWTGFLTSIGMILLSAACWSRSRFLRSLIRVCAHRQSLKRKSDESFSSSIVFI